MKNQEIYVSGRYPILSFRKEKALEIEQVTKGLNLILNVVYIQEDGMFRDLYSIPSRLLHAKTY